MRAVCNCSNIPATNSLVCASDGATYGNECIAQCANVLIVSEGECPYCKIVTNGELQTLAIDQWVMPSLGGWSEQVQLGKREPVASGEA